MKFTTTPRNNILLMHVLSHFSLSLFLSLPHFLKLVELKNGETFNGHLVNCDNFMNITLREVYQTSADADRFWKLKECYIRGSTVRLSHSSRYLKLLQSLS